MHLHDLRPHRQLFIPIGLLFVRNSAGIALSDVEVLPLTLCVRKCPREYRSYTH